MIKIHKLQRIFIDLSFLLHQMASECSLTDCKPRLQKMFHLLFLVLVFLFSDCFLQNLWNKERVVFLSHWFLLKAHQSLSSCRSLKLDQILHFMRGLKILKGWELSFFLKSMSFHQNCIYHKLTILHDLSYIPLLFKHDFCLQFLLIY